MKLYPKYVQIYMTIKQMKNSSNALVYCIFTCCTMVFRKVRGGPANCVFSLLTAGTVCNLYVVVPAAPATGVVLEGSGAPGCVGAGPTRSS